MGLRLHVCWDSGFESRWGHGCLSLGSVVGYRYVRRADHSSRGVLPSVVCLSVIVKLLLCGAPGPVEVVVEPLGGGGEKLADRKQWRQILEEAKVNQGL